MSRAKRPWYLAGPVSGTEDRRALARARDALTARGHAVVAPALAHLPTDSVDDLAAVMAADFDALAASSLLVMLPGSAGLWESPAAVALGVPAQPLADALGARVPA